MGEFLDIRTNKLTNIKPFKLSALEKLAEIIGDRYTGSQITELFNKSGFQHIVHDGTTKWRFVYAIFKSMQKEQYGDYNILKVVETLCDPQEYFSDPEEQIFVLSRVNKILSFYGLKVRKDGKIIKTEEEQKEFPKINHNSETRELFESMNFHSEVRRNGKDLFSEERYFHAVFECSKALEKYIQQKSKSHLTGTKLMNNVLSLRGSLKINLQQTQTEKDEQDGVRYLCMGLMMKVRNFTSHELALEKPIPKKDALDVLSLISYLYRKIDDAVYFKNKNH